MAGAKKVTEVAVIREWHLTIPEQEALLRILTQPPKKSARLIKATATARELFGPIDIGTARAE